MKRFKSSALIAIIVIITATLLIAAADKKKITRLDDLPRYTYNVSGKASELLVSEEKFAVFAEQVKADILKTLDEYEIEDETTLKRLYGTLIGLGLIDGDGESVMRYVQKRRTLEEKPADKLMSGLTAEALVSAWEEKKSTDTEAVREVFVKNLKEKVNDLPWDICQDEIERIKGSTEMLSRNVLVGLIQSQIDPAAEKTGNISGDVADQIVGFRSFIVVNEPFKDDVVKIYNDYIKAHKVAKSDIWKKRQVDLTEGDEKNEVNVGIWDSGVDAGVYGDQMFVNKAEKPDGKDDDDNGFIDDIHGIAFDLKENYTTDMLYPLPGDGAARLAEMKNQIKGLQDLQAAIDSEEASELKQKMGSMKPEDVKPFIEELNLFAVYAHGTHVAGIAVNGNPYARILIARITFDHRVIPEPPTLEVAHRAAQNYMSTVKYFQKNDVRVVNMSWGWSFKEIEGMLEANGIGKDADERRQKAREIFDIYKNGLYDAMKSAPQILFVTAAGNSDNDVAFDEVIPSSFELPNLLTVGAVDIAGEETSFTSFGKNVTVHANGFEVESYLPGGEKIEFSGTSMASPNVTNLAAKLFALDPSLTCNEVVSLIKRGVNSSEDGRLFLVNPKRSVKLLKESSGE